MSDESLELVKRFEHMSYDMWTRSYELWHGDGVSFDEVWAEEEPIEKSCPEPNWEQRCRDRGLIEFYPYSKEVIELKLAIMGY